jgi:hypothetical protein
MREPMIRILLAVAGLFIWPSVSIALVAAVGGDGYSFGFAPASTSNGETVYFTTHDGLSGMPLLECDTSCIASEELYPNALGSTQYLADYLVADSVGVYEFGTAIMDVVSSDTDGDGMLDVLELPRTGGFSFSGLTYPDFNAFGIYYNSTVVGSTTRPAGIRQGTYSGSLSNPSQTAFFGGVYALSGAYGTVEYFLDGSNVLNWSLAQRAIDGAIRTFTGTSTVSFIGTTTLVLPSFSALDSRSGLFLQTLPTTLTRSGNTFRGILRLVDGEPNTSWSDYVNYNVEIVDTNDTNDDGLPDILAVPEPALATQLIVSSLTIQLLLCRRRHKRSESSDSSPAGAN